MIMMAMMALDDVDNGGDGRSSAALTATGTVYQLYANCLLSSY